MNAPDDHGPPPPAPSCLIALPPAWFYLRNIACGGVGDPARLDAVAALAIESESPFPTDRLVVRRTGVIADRTSVFVALRDRIDPVCADTTTRHIVPLAALPLPGAASGRVAIRSDDTVIVVTCDAGLPVACRSWPENEYKATSPDEALWRPDGTERQVSPDGVLLRWRDERRETTATTFAPAAWLDGADVRPGPVVAALRTADRTRRWLAPVFLVLAGALLLAALAQGGVRAMNAVAARREAALEARRPAAQDAEARAALLETLADVTTRRTPQLERLAALNGPRPDAVWLTHTALDTKGVAVTGRASSMEALNGWLAALRRDGAFTEIVTPRIAASAGRDVLFELRAVAASKTAGKKPR